MGTRSSRYPPEVTGSTKASPSSSSVVTIQLTSACRVPMRHGAISTFLASSSRTRISPLLVFCIKWMVMLAIRSEMHHTAPATSGVSANR